MTEQPDSHSEVPSVHRYETDIDIADLPYEATSDGAVWATFGLTIALGAVAGGLSFLGNLPGALAAAVAAVVALTVFVRVNRKHLAASGRNVAMRAERINTVRPIVQREFGVTIPEVQPGWSGKPAFIEVIPVGAQTVVLSAGMNQDPTTVLIRFYPKG
jgi:hypothetical protein